MMTAFDRFFMQMALREAEKAAADGDRVVWCDFNDKFLEPGPDKVLPRSLMPDLLHPNHEGYLIWEAAVRPYFEKYCK